MENTISRPLRDEYEKCRTGSLRNECRKHDMSPLTSNVQEIDHDVYEINMRNEV